MKTTLHRIVVTLSLMVASSIANATLIEFDPADSVADLGDTVAIDIVATPEAGELIGEYDFIVNFDPSILALDNVVFGNALNDDPLFCALLGCRGFNDVGGAANLFEVSLVFPLSLLQDGASSIVLATLFFDTIGVGTSGLSFAGNIPGQPPGFDILGDEFGFALPVFDPGIGSVTVRAVQVPEPGTLVLMLSGLVLLVRRRNKL